MFFETERLKARRLIIEDLQAFHEMQGNPKVMRYIAGKEKTFEENKEELIKWIKRYESVDNALRVMAAACKESNELIGTCAVIGNGKGEYEIGYRLLEKYWSNGHGEEILKGLLKYCLETMHLNSVDAYVDMDNVASVRLLEKAGFTRVDESVGQDFDNREGHYKYYFACQDSPSGGL